MPSDDDGCYDRVHCYMYLFTILMNVGAVYFIVVNCVMNSWNWEWNFSCCKL